MIDLDITLVHDTQLGCLAFPAFDSVIAPEIRNSGSWEPEETEILKQYLKHGDRCVNVGANVGYFAAHMSRLVGDSGSVLAIEPNPRLLPLLRLNTAQCRNVQILDSAAGDYDGTVDLYINNTNCGDNRAFDADPVEEMLWMHEFTEPPITVPMIALDSVLDEQVHFVLLDTQGFDHRVIRGMSDHIKQHHPVILTEFAPDLIQSQGTDPEDVLRFYVSLGYAISSPNVEIRALPLDQVVSKIWEHPPRYANLLLTIG